MKKLFLCAAVVLMLMGCRDDAPDDCVIRENGNALMDAEGEEVCPTPPNPDKSDADGCTIYEGEQECLNP